MKKRHCLIIHSVILLALSGYMPLMADNHTTFATYKPIPMQSTSAMPLGTSGMEIGWDKPGTWSDPVDDDEGGGSGGFDKPGNWDDPYEGENPATPVGDGVLPLIVFLAAYAAWKRRKLKSSI